jgi:hypothetical protein
MLPDLVQYLKLLQDKVHAQPEHALFLEQRVGLYNLLDPDESIPTRNRVRPWLEMLTVRQVLPQWQVITQDKLWQNYYHVPEMMAALAEELLSGKVDPQSVRVQAAHWLEVADLSGELPNSRYYHAWCVFDAAIATLYTALGYSFLDQTALMGSDPDPEQLARNTDAAAWAAIAYAGGVWTPDFSQEMEYGRVVGNWNRDLSEVRAKRYEFWTWWLQDAVPSAIEKVTQR